MAADQGSPKARSGDPGPISVSEAARRSLDKLDNWLRAAHRFGMGARPGDAPLLELMAEGILCSAVNGFTTYLAEVMTEALQLKPELLLDSGGVKKEEAQAEQRYRVDLKTVLESDSKAEIVARIVERRVFSDSMRGLKRVLKTLRNTFQVKPFTTPDWEKALLFIVELRNLYVHNRGVVSRRFLSSIADSGQPLGQYKLDEQVTINLEVVVRMVGTIINATLAIDEKVAESHGVKRDTQYQVADFTTPPPA